MITAMLTKFIRTGYEKDLIVIEDLSKFVNL